LTTFPREAALSILEFVHKWQDSTLSERAGSQSHFIELCQALGHKTPTGIDVTGESFTFEKGVKTLGGDQGWADVWYRNHFAWEYKGKHRDLVAAYEQLQKYREQLENPPLLVVCDFDRFEVHTNFTYFKPTVYSFNLADLAANKSTPTCALRPLEVLDALFNNPSRLKPDFADPQVTEEAAAKFAEIAKTLQQRYDGEKAAHFLMRILFCLFSEDIGLLPDKIFTKLIQNDKQNPARFAQKLKLLFSAMSSPNGSFGAHDIDYFNGGLFSDNEILELTTAEMNILMAAASLNWAHVEPAIIGTLFVRSLDPTKRSQLGAQYTRREDILLIVEPVLMAPLRRRWQEVQEKADVLLKATDKEGNPKVNKKALQELLLGFAEEISRVRVLDPACGSGNFLYVSLKLLLDLEREVRNFAISCGLTGWLNEQVGPQQIYGIEINTYAHELASVVVWIGYLQWLHDNGSPTPTRPILKPLHNILHMDSIVAHGKDGVFLEPEWPDADVIVGNPPFLGGKKLRSELGDIYVDGLFELYSGKVSPESDLVVYWFEKAREQVKKRKAGRVGLLATQAIRGGANRAVLERIMDGCNIFYAVSDRDWVLEGASVHVSMVAFDEGEERQIMLDGVPVQAINSDLTTGLDLTKAMKLLENDGICFMGTTKIGPFDITRETALGFLKAPTNPNGKSNSDVVRPWVNARDLTDARREQWIIDFGTMSQEEAAFYEGPFEYVKQHVFPERKNNRRASYASRWWLHGEARPALRAALKGKSRFILTPRVSRHRVFVWRSCEFVPDSATFAFAREDDYFFGVLHSKINELWSRQTGTQLREEESGFRYTPETTFEKFPFPWVPGSEPTADPRYGAIARSAKRLVELRDLWLNPPDASPMELRKRTLTNLYNQNPQWLQDAHRALDVAVFDAYGWPNNLIDSEILERLLALNHERAQRTHAVNTHVS
jgi:type II restriction/modification system DNA methylase subunit YeeA